MKRLLVIIAAVYFGFMMGLIVWVTNPPPLPHRAVDELTNWGQGHAPPGNVCPPGTIRFDTDDGLFLECYRGTDHVR